MFQELQKKAQSLTPQKVKSDLFRFIRTLEKELASVNADRLHTQSEDVDGNPIGFYSAATEAITGGRKRMGQPFDLKETGVFLNSLFAEVDNDSIFFDTSDDKKEEVLQNLLSKEIFGLTDLELNRVIEKELLPYLLEYFNKNLLG
tara:strand:- start:1607 stop:2044 length:438 start_codon:yes stop_codon:yes gene_type:complete